MSNGDEGGGASESEALDAAGEIAKGVGESVGGVTDAAGGDLAGAVGGVAQGLGGLADGLGGALPEGEARGALATAGAVVKTAGQLVGAGQALAGAAQGGDLGKAASGLGSLGGATDASRYIVPDNEVQKVLGGVGQAASVLQQGGQLLDGLGGGLGGQRNDDVAFNVEVNGADGQWGLTSVVLSEALNEVSACTIEALYSDHITSRDLLHKNVSLTIERQSQTRSFKGIVFHASVRDDVEGTHVELRVAPAAALLEKHFNSDIFQAKTVVQVIQEVFDRRIGPTQRTLRDDTSRSYEVREYIVQYQESDLAFISRLAEEEGIFWYFDHEDEHEVLVLCDSVSGLPQARADDEGRVQYHGDASQAPDGESAWEIRHDEEIGTTDAVVADYDWTHPPLQVREEQTGRGEHEPALEVYDHSDALIFHDSGGRQYEGNTAKVQAQMRAERLDLDRQHWALETSVVTALPGHTLELVGAPDGELDQRYLITSASCRGSATHGATGSWESSLSVTPTSLPYRPARRTPRPVPHGPETALVVGPSGDDIYTDEHGRVKVHFHWDRRHARTAEDSSCWLRVVHNWAGPGYGTIFIPRIGMEVLVQFLGGNPDRPIITGCIYNGDNAAPATPLPDKKTQSVIRTKSSVNGDGFNELRFEDKQGAEFVYIHAEKDFNEEVEHSHSTRVKNNQSNTVDNDQTETIGHDQTMTVKNDRTKSVDGNETTFIGGGEGGPGNRAETVWGDEGVSINQSRSHFVKKDESLLVEEGKRTVTVQTGEDHETYFGRRITSVAKYDILNVVDGANHTVAVSGQYDVMVDGAHYSVQQGGTERMVQANR